METVVIGIGCFVAGFGISWGLACIFGMEPCKPCELTEEQWRKYGWKKEYKQ
jgi:hypothetical protein